MSTQSKLSVGNKCGNSHSIFSLLSSHNPANYCRICSPSEIDGVRVVTFILQLVEELDGDGTLKWPAQIIIKDTTHHTAIHGHIGFVSRPTAIGTNLDAHSVAMSVSVERRRVPAITCPLIYAAQNRSSQS